MFRALLLLFLLFFSNAIQANSESVKYKSALIYNIVKYVDWPNEQNFQQYVITYVGDDEMLFDELVSASNFVKVNQLPVSVHRSSAQQVTGTNSQVIFISKSHANLVSSIAANTRKTNTLVICEESEAKRDFMVNIYQSEKKYKFEVNSSNVVYEGLKLHKDILLLGGTQLDVAKLLRSSESSLEQARQEINSNQKVLNAQQEKIRQFRMEFTELRSETVKKQLESEQLKKQLNEQTQKLVLQQKVLKDTRQQADLAKVELTKNKHAYNQVSAELSHKKQLLKSNKQQMAQLEANIAKNVEILAQQTQTLNQQTSKLEQKDHQITTQKHLLIATVSALAVFFIMTIIIYRIYLSRKLAKERLLSSYQNIKTIGQLGLEVTACLDFEQAVNALYHHVQTLMDATIFTLGIYNQNEDKINYNFSYCRGVKYKSYQQALTDKALFAVYCFKHQKSFIINDAELDYQQFFPNYLRIQDNAELENGAQAVLPRAMLYIPLISKNQVSGIISVQSDKRFAYNQTDMDILSTLAAYTAVALENSINHEKIKQAQEQLVIQEKMASLGLLTAGVAHEINNPTNFTRLSAQNLQVDLQNFKEQLVTLAGGDAIDEKVKAIFDQEFEQLNNKLTIILDGTTRIKNTVQDLRSFTRQDSGEKCLVDISETLESTIRLVQAKYQNSITITYQSQDHINLDCWPAQLNQVFLNIIVNGCDAINDKISQEPSHQGKIDINLSHTEHQIEISFTDNGIGMDEQTSKKLFEPFYTTKMVGEGTGLGMAISLGIIQKHNGSIKVQSTLGQGSCFTVCLPY